MAATATATTPLYLSQAFLDGFAEQWKQSISRVANVKHLNRAAKKRLEADGTAVLDAILEQLRQGNTRTEALVDERQQRVSDKLEQLRDLSQAVKSKRAQVRQAAAEATTTTSSSSSSCHGDDQKQSPALPTSLQPTVASFPDATQMAVLQEQWHTIVSSMSHDLGWISCSCSCCC
jgi:uncharacterized phage infection (PIP) family protein YhgE